MEIILVGATGQMGHTVANLVKGTDNVIVAGVGQGKVDIEDFPVFEDFDFNIEADVIIDFSSPTILKNVLDYAKSKSIPAVIASTGHSDENIKLIEEYSKIVPIVFTGNTSIGINIMEYIVEEMSRLLEGFDIEIVERHHNKKLDAPSGTALMLYESANAGRDNRLHPVEGRAGVFESPRDENEVGISAIRGGTIVGEHSVIFAGIDEVLEITHIAQSKNIFANGALKAGKFLLDKDPGLYNMDHVLEILNG